MNNRNASKDTPTKQVLYPFPGESIDTGKGINVTSRTPGYMIDPEEDKGMLIAIWKNTQNGFMVCNILQVLAR